MDSTPSRTGFGLALLVVVAGGGLLAWRLSGQLAPEPVDTGPAASPGAEPVAPADQLDPPQPQAVTGEVSLQAARADATSVDTTGPGTAPVGELQDAAVNQALRLDPGAVAASDLVSLLVRRFDPEGGGAVNAYHTKPGSGQEALPWIELEDDHFPPKGAGAVTGREATPARGMLGTEDWRPGHVMTKRSDLVGYVRVPIWRRDLGDPVPIEWIGVGALTVEWLEESPLGRDVVEVTRTDPPSQLLAAASVRLPSLPLVQMINLKGTGPDRTGNPVSLLEGNYTWRTRGGGPGLEGSLAIVQGETEVLQIEPPRAITFAGSLVVDATAALEADLSHSEVLLFHSNRPAEQQRNLTLQASSENGIWTTPDFEVTSGDGDGWRILLTPIQGFEWSEFTVPVPEDEPVVRVTLTDAGEPFVVSVTVLGSDTEELLEKASIRYGRGLEVHPPITRYGVHFSCEATGSKPIDFFVASRGYKTMHVVWTRGSSDEDFVVRLEPGFRERVLAFDVRTMSPMAGVPVFIGEKAVGKTDEDGVLWLTERGPMMRPTIGPSWTTIHASLAFAEEVDGKEWLAAEPSGWFFAVEPPKESR